MSESVISVSAAQPAHEREGDGYLDFLESIRQRFINETAVNPPLFTTSASGLFDAFLDALPAEARQHYTCSACRRFVERYGGLVTISPDGAAVSVMWGDDAPAFFQPSIAAIRRLIRKASVTGVFLSEEAVWGEPITGEWRHMAVTPSRPAYGPSGQRMAQKREDFKMLLAGLAEFPLPVVEAALNLLRTESLYRSEKVLGVAEWLYKLHVACVACAEAKSEKIRRNLIWQAVATAPAGFCHVRSTMIGTLLEDIAAGTLPFAEISRRFASKMNPTIYQRPQAAPAAGNIAQAEKIVADLGLERALHRRFARLEELDLLWRPQPSTPAAPAGNGVFAHVRPKTKKGAPEAVVVEAPPVTMTWVKFHREVLPGALAMEYLVKSRPANYGAILTATYADAPPILQWDREERRNPFSWYVHVHFSAPSAWLLAAGYTPVTGVCFQPSMWYGGHYPHQGKSVFFILAGARDRHNGGGIGLFPEILRNDLHGVRATIEAYSGGRTLDGAEEASACGIKFEANQPVTLRVTTATGKQVYMLDRWD